MSSPVSIQLCNLVSNPRLVTSQRGCLILANTVHGSQGFGRSSTYDSLRNSSCTSCQLSVDKSAYYFPLLYYRSQDGHSFSSIRQNGGALIYYLFRRDTPDIPLVAFPKGFQMVTGNIFDRSQQNTSEAHATMWTCINYESGSEGVPAIPSTHCPENLRMQIEFPSCWDGVNVDSPDHKSHGNSVRVLLLMVVAYPSSIDNGVCPSAFPVRLPTLYVEIEWIIHDFADQWYDNASHPFVLSTGDPTGYGSHGAFQNGWDVNILQQALNTCDNGTSIDECPILQNYTQPSSVQASCSLCISPSLSGTDLSKSVSGAGFGHSRPNAWM